MILGNVITTIITPFANVFGWVLAGFYSFTHSYGLAIILLTLLTMVVVFPLTRAGTRSMMRMQLLQPELMKIRNRHKMQPGMAPQERQEARQALNNEMMALYRENGVNPTGGCIPMFMQFPIFIVLYDVIRGMTRLVTIGHGKAAHAVLSPQYIPKKTQLYHAVISSKGHLESFGLNLASSVRTPQHSWVHVLPYAAVILIAVVLQYVSIWQITNRNPSAAQANPQMQAIQKFMPLIFVFLYIVLPAGVGVYFIVSSMFRVGQQEYMYKHDPKITAAVSELRQRKAIAAKAKPASSSAKKTGSSVRATPKGFMERLRDVAMPGMADVEEEEEPPPAPVRGGVTAPGGRPKTAGTSRPNSQANGKSPNKSSSTSSNGRSPAPRPKPTAQNRSRAKRRRRA